MVLDQIPKTLGGGERIAFKLAELLPSYGYRASLLTFGIHPESSVGEICCPVYLLPLSRTYGPKAIRAALHLQNFIDQENIQIVQTFFESSDLWAGFVTKSLSDALLVWSRRDMGILRSRKHVLGYRLMSGLPDAVLAVSEEVRRYCIDVDRINPACLSTLYNGIDLSQWPQHAREVTPNDRTHITTVGNIRRVKGHDIFIRAAAGIRKRFPSTHFSIAGAILDANYFDELRNLVEELNLTGQFDFLGGGVDPRKHLRECDIFVLPSRSEGFSNALIEAMASSLPVVATCVGGNAEAVADGVTGYLVAPDDASAMATALEKLLVDPNKARMMGSNGRTRVVEKFTTDVMMRAWVARFEELLTSN